MDNEQQRRQLDPKLYGLTTNDRGNEIRSNQLPVGVINGAIGSVMGKLILGDVVIDTARIDILDVGLITASVYDGVVSELATITGVDATTGGTVLIHDSATSADFIKIHSIVIETEDTYNGAGKTINATFNIGFTAPNYIDYVNSETYTFTAGEQFVKIDLDGAVYPIWTQAVSELYLNITTPSDATVENWTITIYGTGISNL